MAISAAFAGSVDSRIISINRVSSSIFYSPLL